MGLDGTLIDHTLATVRALQTGDASVEVTRVSVGTGEPLGGTWYLVLDGEASNHIAADASAEDIAAVVANLSRAGNVSVSDVQEGPRPNGARSWVITFHDWNDPRHASVAPNLQVGTESLTGIAPSARLDTSGNLAGVGSTSQDESVASTFCSKSVAHVSSLLSTGHLENCYLDSAGWGGTSYAIPSFPFNANSSVLESALAAVGENVLGPVWVSHEELTATDSGGVWNITFVGNAEGRVPDLTCGPDATVFWLVNSSCPAIGGVFTLEWDGNVTQEISYNASAPEVGRFGRSTMPSIQYCVKLIA